MSSRQFQITGKRAVALKQLLEVAPKNALDSILAHVGSMGWQQCVWSEEVLSSKKIYPKFAFPCNSKKWGPRCRTSEASLCLMIERVQNQHAAQSPMIRQKMTPSTAEMMAESAAAVLAIAQEISLTAPIDDQKLQSAWVRAWAGGSDHVHTEIQLALMEKSESFDPAVHLSTMKRLVDEHIFQAPLAPAEEVQKSLHVDEFNLDMKKLEYDTTVFENWEKKCGNVVTARYHAELEPPWGQSNIFKTWWSFEAHATSYNPVPNPEAPKKTMRGGPASRHAACGGPEIPRCLGAPSSWGV